MSIHRDCGEEIRWAHRDDDLDRWQPPLEFAGQAYILDERGVAVMVTVYKRHVCDPDKMEAWIAYQRRVAELKDEEPILADGIQARDLAKQRENERLWEFALKIECRRCGEPSGSKCHSLDQKYRKTGELVEIKNPHLERIKDSGFRYEEVN